MKRGKDGCAADLFCMVLSIAVVLLIMYVLDIPIKQFLIGVYQVSKTILQLAIDNLKVLMDEIINTSIA